MKFHPMVRTFGKRTNGAFTSSDLPNLGNPDWFFTRATGSGYLIDGHVYLAHTGVEIDKEVWLTQQGVIEGKDDVVEAAIEWINNASSVNDDENGIVKEYYLNQNFPNPFNPTTTIKYRIPELCFVNVKVFDVLGEEIETLVDEEKPTGNYEVKFSANRLSSGIYFYTLTAGEFRETKKMILLR
jgi:hypothetical protein